MILHETKPQKEGVGKVVLEARWVQQFCESSPVLQRAWLCASSIRPSKKKPPLPFSLSLLSRKFQQTVPALEMPCLQAGFFKIDVFMWQLIGKKIKITNIYVMNSMCLPEESVPSLIFTVCFQLFLTQSKRVGVLQPGEGKALGSLGAPCSA